MTLNIIPSDLPTLTGGERRILEKIRTLYKDINHEVFLYIQPRIRNLEPDFILIDSKRGLCILEIKDWGISYIKKANQRKVFLNDGKEVANPLLKTNQYNNATNGLFSFQDVLINDEGKLKFKIFSKVIFTNLSAKDIKQNNLNSVFQSPPSTYTTSEEISQLKTDDFYGLDTCNLNTEELVAIRTLLFPEIRIMKKSETAVLRSNTSAADFDSRELIKALDAEQEKFAKRLPYGHYMVTGIPGSGKTVILLARAIHLVRQHPEWSIRILTYNNSLKNKLNSSLDLLADDANFMEIPLGNIEVSTFHKFAMETAGISSPKDLNKRSEEEKRKWWAETLPNKALDRATPKYDAILVDEYQDFHDNWIRLCIKSCITHTFNDNKQNETTRINLFLAGDRLQSIYKVREQSWKEIGINMQGRSKLLNKSYRSGNEHVDLALKFLKQNKTLQNEVDKFYSPQNELSFDNNVPGSVSFLEGANRDVAQTIYDLVYKVGYAPKDILVLCKDWDTCRKFKEMLADELQRKTEVTKDVTGSKLVITTYYSSKGLEAPITFLMNVDTFKEQSLNENDILDRKLLYVGMTRASERLYIHARNFSAGSYADKLKEIVR